MSRPPESAPRYEPPRRLRSYRVEELLRDATDVFLITGPPPFPKPEPGPQLPQPPISQWRDDATPPDEHLI